MKKWIIIGLAVALAGGAWFWASRSKTGDEANLYTFGEVERGSLTDTVSATGTLGALETVVVGTQVSGIVEKVLVDFNDQVKQGQLLASIETEQLDAARIDAVASRSAPRRSWTRPRPRSPNTSRSSSRAWCRARTSCRAKPR